MRDIQKLDTAQSILGELRRKSFFVVFLGHFVFQKNLIITNAVDKGVIKVLCIDSSKNFST